MCGIAGFLVNGTLDDPVAVMRRMTRSLRHRGPDDEGVHVDDRVALGARRLSVIDLATGQQPLANEDGTVWVVQNGEIYNFRALRTRLESRGHRFRTASDSEVLVHAWEEYGEDCVQHLDGMFAFAIWDSRRDTLFLARDRLGEKPLYYWSGAGGLVFGSELRALLEHPGVPRELSLQALSRYLAYEYVPAPDSILTGVAKLPPAHTLTVERASKPRVAPYWDLTFVPERGVDEREWAARLLRQLETSVERRLISDVPLGLFLSGGIDSGAIVALAARLNPGRRLQTFTVGFGDASFDERRFARTVARHCGTDHEEVVFTAADVEGLFAETGALLDEPLVDGSFLPIYVLSRLARGSVTVTLSGDGGDEIFCGYPTFIAERGARWVGRLPTLVQRAATAAVNRLPPSPRYGSVEFLLKQFFRALPHPQEVRTQLLLGGLTALEQASLFSPGVRAACADFDPFDDLASALVETHGLDPLDRLVYQHCKFYLAEQNLVTVDRASMAVGLEVRAPFLDHALVELAGRMPADVKLRGWTTKYVLKQALRGVLPDEILDRRKQGFGVPIGAWLRGPLRPVLEDRLSRARVERLGLFDAAAIGRLVAEHLRGRKDHRKILWALLMLDVWLEHYLPSARWG